MNDKGWEGEGCKAGDVLRGAGTKAWVVARQAAATARKIARILAV